MRLGRLAVARELTGLSRHLPGAHPQTSLLDTEPFVTSLARYAVETDTPADQVRAEASAHLEEMSATHERRLTAAWDKFTGWMLRAHDVVIDEEQLVTLRRLDRGHSLAFVFSHRSYLDAFVLPLTLEARRFDPTFIVGGSNMNIPIFGHVASRTGTIFIRRSTKDAPLYRVVLRCYTAYLTGTRANLAWSIEGGRTRTGKLRPPVHGILRYVVDAAKDTSRRDVMLVPVSIVYDQLHEVGRMTAEALGTAKTPENLGWLMSLARSQRRRLGRAYLTFGDPMPIRERMATLRAEGVADDALVARIALDASHRINRATPVTITAVVCLALLGADRALSFGEVLATVTPLADYIAARRWPVAGGATLTDRSSVRRALHELVASGVLDTYDAGTEAVWNVAADRHLVAAFYRNTLIHVLVERAIAEVALLAAAEAIERSTRYAASAPPDRRRALTSAWSTALAMRDLLKFEFFFPGRDVFESELRAEVSILAPALAHLLDTDSLAPDATADSLAAASVEAMVEQAPVLLAHLVLRPFVDAYLLLADRLAAAGDDDIDDAELEDLLLESLRLGGQWVRQRRIASAESVSLELLRTGAKLAEHRGLLRAAAPLAPTSDDDAPRTAPGLGARRTAFLAEVSALSARLGQIAQLAEVRRPRTDTADSPDHRTGEPRGR